MLVPRMSPEPSSDAALERPGRPHPVAAPPGASGPAPRERAWIDRTWFGVLLAASVFALTYLAVVELHGRPPDDTDEPEWIAISLAHAGKLVGEEAPGTELDRQLGQLDQNAWRQGVLGTTFGWANPGLAKLVWGFSLRAAGHAAMPPAVFFRYNKDLPEPVRDTARARTRPARRLARKHVASWVALTASALCLLARAALGGGLSGLLCGLGAAALFVASPIVLLWGFYVRPDFLMLALVSCAGALAAVRARSSRPAGLGFAVALGVLAGLATGTKLNGALSAFFVAIALPVVVLATRPASESAARAVRRSLVGLVVAGLVCCATFWALFPSLWEPGTLGELLEFWDRHIAHQQERMLTRDDTGVARTLSERIALGSRLAFEKGEPLTKLLGLPERPWGPLLCLLGLALLLARALGLGSGRQATRGDRAAAVCALAWTLVIAAGTTLWIPIEWDRYLFAYSATGALAEAVLLGSLAAALARLRKG